MIKISYKQEAYIDTTTQWYIYDSLILLEIVILFYIVLFAVIIEKMPKPLCIYDDDIKRTQIRIIATGKIINLVNM